MRLGLGFGLDNHRRILSGFVGLLDTYAGAAAAYSIRLLSSTYSGALVEIRRSSDNALKSFFPDINNELSLSSEDGASTSLSSWIGSDNGFVRTWFDQSGNSRDNIQTSASIQPRIIVSGALLTNGGKARIDSVSDRYLNHTEVAVDSAFIVGAKTDASGFTAYYLGSATTNNSGIIYNFSSNGLTSFANPDIVSLGNTTTTNRELSAFYTDGVDSFLSINGDAFTNAGSFTAQMYSERTFRRRVGTVADQLNGFAQEIIEYSSNQSANAAGIKANQNEYFSIY